eukprot:3462040-Amphidinium_carterae.1
MLEDPTFATEAKREEFHLLKLRMLSGRSTVVAARSAWIIEIVLERCCSRLNLADDGSTIKLWHGTEM